VSQHSSYIEWHDGKKYPVQKKVLRDGFGNSWSIKCFLCKKNTMEIVRPGKVQCTNGC